MLDDLVPTPPPPQGLLYKHASFNEPLTLAYIILFILHNKLGTRAHFLCLI